jgi:hypothetical protein
MVFSLQEDDLSVSGPQTTVTNSNSDLLDQSSKVTDPNVNNRGSKVTDTNDKAKHSIVADPNDNPGNDSAGSTDTNDRAVGSPDNNDNCNETKPKDKQEGAEGPLMFSEAFSHEAICLFLKTGSTEHILRKYKSSLNVTVHIDSVCHAPASKVFLKTDTSKHRMKQYKFRRDSGLLIMHQWHPILAH